MEVVGSISQLLRKTDDFFLELHGKKFDHNKNRFRKLWSHFVFNKDWKPF